MRPRTMAPMLTTGMNDARNPKMPKTKPATASPLLPWVGAGVGALGCGHCVCSEY